MQGTLVGLFNAARKTPKIRTCSQNHVVNKGSVEKKQVGQVSEVAEQDMKCKLRLRPRVEVLVG